eukprot:3193406-Pyramimonas_sp.AAC.1
MRSHPLLTVDTDRRTAYEFNHLLELAPPTHASPEPAARLFGTEVRPSPLPSFLGAERISH